MKISFITPKPPYNGFSYFKIPSLGGLYLGTILKNEGHDVRVYDEKLKLDLSGLDDFILSSDFVGISILSANANRGYELADRIRELNPKTKILFGGVHATALPEEAAEHGDHVVLGEAELVISDIINGNITDTIVPGIKPNLNELPFVDFSLLENKEKMTVLPISTSRGCPYNCNFCYSTSLYGPKIRSRSGDNIFEEIKLRHEQGYDNFFFSDDNTPANRDFKRFLENIINADFKIKWHAESEISVAKDEEMLRLIKESNCGNLQIGLESIDQKSLDSYNKRQNVEEVEYYLRRLNEYKIPVHGMFMINDKDNKKTILDTVKFALKNKLTSIHFTILSPFPGTGLYETLDNAKKILTKYWNWFDGSHAVYAADSRKEMQKNLEYGFKQFYSIKNTLKDLFKLDIEYFKVKLVGYFYSRIKLREWRRTNKPFLKTLSD